MPTRSKPLPLSSGMYCAGEPFKFALPSATSRPKAVLASDLLMEYQMCWAYSLNPWKYFSCSRLAPWIIATPSLWFCSNSWSKLTVLPSPFGYFCKPRSDFDGFGNSTIYPSRGVITILSGVPILRNHHFIKGWVPWFFIVTWDSGVGGMPCIGSGEPEFRGAV